MNDEHDEIDGRLGARARYLRRYVEMPSRRYRLVPDPDDRPFLIYKFRPKPPSVSEQQALQIYVAGIVRWLEERRRRRDSGGQDATG